MFENALGVFSLLIQPGSVDPLIYLVHQFELILIVVWKRETAENEIWSNSELIKLRQNQFNLNTNVEPRSEETHHVFS